MKKRVIATLIYINCLLLVLSACGQKDIGEAKAREIVLQNFNRIFDLNETEASVTMEKMDSHRDASGVLVTGGNSELPDEWIYHVHSASSSSINYYEAIIVGSTGEILYASRSMANIILTDAQKKQAEELYAENSEWEEKHMDAIQVLNQACYDWAKAKLDESNPIVLNANRAEIPRVKIRQFERVYYVVTREGSVYTVTMSWPSLQLLSFEVENGLKS